jgi:hypothetical protein
LLITFRFARTKVGQNEDQKFFRTKKGFENKVFRTTIFRTKVFCSEKAFRTKGFLEQSRWCFWLTHPLCACLYPSNFG